MTLRTPSDVRDDMTNAAVVLADAGFLKIYTGTQPASADDAPTGTLLATFDLEDPAYSVASSGAPSSLQGTPIETTAVATGTAGWARVTSSTSTTVYDGKAGLATDDPVPEFILTFTTITSADTVTLISGSFGVASGE